MSYDRHCCDYHTPQVHPRWERVVTDSYPDLRVMAIPGGWLVTTFNPNFDPVASAPAFVPDPEHVIQWDQLGDYMQCSACGTFHPGECNFVYPR